MEGQCSGQGRVSEEFRRATSQAKHGKAPLEKNAPAVGHAIYRASGASTFEGC